jgi:hypothetical protein
MFSVMEKISKNFFALNELWKYNNLCLLIRFLSYYNVFNWSGSV